MLIGQKPIFGWDPEGSDQILASLTSVTRPHNEYLQYAVFLGIPGLALYLTSLFTLAVDRLNRLKELDTSTLIAGGSVFAYAASAFFGNTKYYSSPLFFILLG